VLCGGDITKRDWVRWNVTLDEAVDWGGYNVKLRYEWVEFVKRMLGGGSESEQEKSCRHPAVCMMCRNRCKSRISEFEVR
jgi:hypothetical protein